MAGDYDSELFTNDNILPVQFVELSRSAQRSPEERLMWAIFLDGLQCAQLRPDFTGLGAESRIRTGREARRWLYSDSRRRLYDFANICDYLGLNAEAVRRAIVARMATGDEMYRDRRTPVAGRNQVSLGVRHDGSRHGGRTAHRKWR